MAVIPSLTKSYLMWALSASQSWFASSSLLLPFGVTSQIKFLQSLFHTHHCWGQLCSAVLGTMSGQLEVWCNLHAMRVWMGREWQCGLSGDKTVLGRGRRAPRAKRGVLEARGAALERATNTVGAVSAPSGGHAALDSRSLWGGRGKDTGTSRPCILTPIPGRLLSPGAHWVGRHPRLAF